MSVVRLTYAEWVHLAGIRSRSRDGARLEPMNSPYRTGVMSSLVRKGLVESREQSEAGRGERRAYWRIYRIAPEGLRRIAHGVENVGLVPK